MRLYEISEKYRLLEDELINENSDGVVSQDWIERLSAIEDEAQAKLVNIGLVYKNFVAEKEKLVSHLDSVKKKIRSIEEKMEWLINYAQHNMYQLKLDKLKDPLVTLSLQLSPVSVDFDDETLIPEEYFVEKTERRVDKIKLRNHLQSGAKIEGVALIQTEKLRIK